MGTHHSYEEAARRFIADESQFHLGFLVTESSHQATRSLSDTIAGSTADGIRRLLAVDQDVVSAACRLIGSPVHGRLAAAFRRAADERAAIVFSGCGSTGRLAVLLESMWRRCWNGALEGVTAPSSPGSRVRGIITGGDRALIRSAERFEDYAEVGREQTRELRLRRGDLFVAISEGGETSSVIGSALEAADAGCEVFYLFNNPVQILVDRIARSRELIEDPRVVPVDLTTGPMALSGSTRMQATTMELFFAGSAMEDAVCRLIGDDRHARLPVRPRAAGEWCEALASLVGAFDPCVESLAAMVEAECETYRRGRIVAYAADRFLLDIFADTTERTPTFSIPPLRRTDDPPGTPNPWALAFNPHCTSGDAWVAMLGRRPAGLDWDADTYRRLGLHDLDPAPVLDAQEILQYPVGTDARQLYGDALGLVLHVSADEAGLWIRGEDAEARGHASANGRPPQWRFPLPMPATATELFEHVAVKLLLNTVSTATMALMGRIRGNWMVHVSPTNKKLVDRSIRIIADLSGRSYEDAAVVFFRAVHERGGVEPSLVSRILDAPDSGGSTDARGPRQQSP